MRWKLLLLPFGLLAVGLAMAFCSSLERNAAIRADVRSEAAGQLRTAMVEQEIGLDGFLLAGRDSFLDPYSGGDDDGEAAEAVLRRTADAETRDLLREHEIGEARWEAMAKHQIYVRRANADYRGAADEMLERKGLMDRLRSTNAALQEHLMDRRDADLRRAGTLSTLAIVALTLALGVAAFLILRTEGRRRRDDYASELTFRSSQREFTDIIQVVRSEPEAHGLLKRHLELSVPDAAATVLNRNNSDNRLEATTAVPAGSPLAQRLEGADPNSCLAVRLGRAHRGRQGEETLMTCGLCGASGKSAACEPLLVGGQVIGSVLVEHEGGLDELGERRLTESVTQAAPVLANLRNLALAERRASTDALTGLPNRRAVQDALRQMVAQASRQVQPLAAIAIDLDRFKDINDRYGHEMGDTVLATVGALLRGAVRASDFIGRQGGEEFLVLAPDTGVEGALTLAENLRVAFEREAIPRLDRKVTGSFGVAVLPDHAGDGDALLRLADRALYSAKSAGRNRVELAIVGDAVAPPVA